MKTKINPEIIIQNSIKNKQRRYYTSFERKQNCLCIRARDHGGKSRGIVGKILHTGDVITAEPIRQLITPDIKKKIDFTVSLLFNNIKRYDPVTK